MTRNSLFHAARQQRLKFLNTGLALALIASALTGCNNNSTTKPLASATNSPSAPLVWQADLGDGRYQNPVIHADYSDPDVIRVGDTYYMTSSSFNSSPALPLLESKDMINWTLVGHALQRQIPLDVYALPQHGNGVWAPCLRYHDGKFWIFYPDPDFGIYVTTAKNFTGPWTEPQLLLAGKGIIDPTPLWDDDGQAYLLHAWAKSRSGINNRLTLRKMSPDASKLLDEAGPVVINGDELPNYRTLEGPKFYKRDGYYYIFAPAGGVEFGWQSVFRSRTIQGPYEDRIVLAQGNSTTNGPHQGAWVQTPEGKDWFFHFQDKGAYGRIVHLQPMLWENGWPVMGQNIDDEGVGEPVAVYPKPVAGKFAITGPDTSDEFNQTHLGLQWQWNANWQSQWYSLRSNAGHLRLFAQYDPLAVNNDNLWNSPAILLQKPPAETFEVTTQLQLSSDHNRDRAGLIVYGFDYAWLGLQQNRGQQELVYVTCLKVDALCREVQQSAVPIARGSWVWLRLSMHPAAKVVFSYSLNGQDFIELDTPFTAQVGRWVGMQMGLFSATDNPDSQSYADVDYFRVRKFEPPTPAANPATTVPSEE